MEINAINIRSYLFSISNKDYKGFTENIVPSSNIIGIRIPVLRKIAKEIAKGNWREFVEEFSSEYYEERLIHGMVIGYAKAEAEEIIKYLDVYVPKINSWAVCDSVVYTLKIIKKYKRFFWDYIQKYLNSNDEFLIRFALVVILSYLINDEYIDDIFNVFDNIDHEGYYVKMAVAWAISYCFIKYPEKTIEYLRNCHLDNFTYNKAIQKTIESFQVNNEFKILIKSMRRRNK